jgi:hypothetical protein
MGDKFISLKPQFQNQGRFANRVEKSTIITKKRRDRNELTTTTRFRSKSLERYEM